MKGFVNHEFLGLGIWAVRSWVSGGCGGQPARGSGGGVEEAQDDVGAGSGAAFGLGSGCGLESVHFVAVRSLTRVNVLKTGNVKLAGLPSKIIKYWLNLLSGNIFVRIPMSQREN